MVLSLTLNVEPSATAPPRFGSEASCWDGRGLREWVGRVRSGLLAAGACYSEAGPPQIFIRGNRGRGHLVKGMNVGDCGVHLKGVQ